MTPLAQVLRLVAHAAARLAGRTPPLPINLTISVTRSCNSRCQTCGIWCSPAGDDDPADELTVGEYERMFASIGRGQTYFLNISGGEPTLRDDLPAIIEAGSRHMAVPHVHLPTNGLDPDRVVESVLDILGVLSDTGAVLSVKPSIDGIGALHDRIRGVSGNYTKVRETLERLLAIREDHQGRLEVGCGTVVSRLNIERVEEVVREMQGLGLDSIIHEIAENREEMGNEDWEITPSVEEYERAAIHFASAIEHTMGHGDSMQALRAGLRLRMIPLTAEWLRTGRVRVPCYAGITNAHVGPRGGLWACAVQARTHRMADLRDHDMDFRSAWSSRPAASVRGRIRSGGCSCPLANQLYANILLDPAELSRALALVARVRRGRGG